MRISRTRFAARLVPWIVPVLLLASWEGLVRGGLLPPSQSAAPSSVLRQFLRLAASSSFLEHAFWSIVRLTAGVALGGVVGMLTGLVLASFRVAKNVLSPTIQLLAGVPI